jgi:hydroxyacylglutathione hydrolase
MCSQRVPHITELRSGIYLFQSEKPSSHVYLIKGQNKNLLIDTGVAKNISLLKDCLTAAGISLKNIHLIVLTHEHFDHIGSTPFFQPGTLVAAHFLAANKVDLQDEFVTLSKGHGHSDNSFRIDLWLEEGARIDLGNYQLEIIHTPGHTSGSICLFEPRAGLLFSGDTIFAGGTLSEIAMSGNVSDYVNSIQKLSNLKIKEIYPGHGRVSANPDNDFRNAIINAENLARDCKVFFEAFIKTRDIQRGKGSSGYWDTASQNTD